MVVSFTISNSRAPPGVTTFTVSPGSLLMSARPIGDVVEIMPFSASASSGITSWNVFFSPLAVDDVQRRAEAGAILRDAVHLDERNLGDALLQHADPRLDEPLPLLGRLILGVLAQVSELTGALDLLGELELQLVVQHLDFVFELFDQPILHRIPSRSGNRTTVLSFPE